MIGDLPDYHSFQTLKLDYQSNMRHLHFNNSSKSGQDVNKFAKQLLDEVFQNKDGIITISVDDGDGDVWKYELHVYSEHKPELCQITEN